MRRSGHGSIFSFFTRLDDLIMLYYITTLQRVASSQYYYILLSIYTSQNICVDYIYTSYQYYLHRYIVMNSIYIYIYIYILHVITNKQYTHYIQSTHNIIYYAYSTVTLEYVWILKLYFRVGYYSSIFVLYYACIVQIGGWAGTEETQRRAQQVLSFEGIYSLVYLLACVLPSSMHSMHTVARVVRSYYQSRSRSMHTLVVVCIQYSSGSTLCNSTTSQQSSSSMHISTMHTTLEYRMHIIHTT